ncbi:MAG: sugar ABC transporter substrate-binding protein [Acetobacteraceae bacterium]
MDLKRSTRTLGVAMGLNVALVIAAFAAGGTPSPTTERPATMHYWNGEFTVSPRIVAKIKHKQPLNFVDSYPYITIAGASAQLQAGCKEAANEIKAKYGVAINCSLIGVPNPDAPTQIEQITSGLNAHQYDCIGVDPNPPGAFNNLIARAMGEGVPVFTVNADSQTSKRISVFSDDDYPDAHDMTFYNQSGKVAGRYAVGWAKQTHHTFNDKQIEMISGDVTQPWAQGRARGFEETIKAAYPHAQFLDNWNNMFMVGFDTVTVLSDMQSFMTSHPHVFFYFSTDWGGQQIAQIIARHHLEGKVFGLGYNLNSLYVQQVRQNQLIGTVDQRYDLQGKNWALACANVLFKHEMPSTQWTYVTPDVWNSSNIDEALKIYSKIPNN